MIKKNKTLTIAMLLGVIAIYGTIAYKSVANKQLDVEQSNINGLDLNYSIVNYKKDNFEINGSIKDPFNSKVSIRNSTIVKIQGPTKPPVQNKKPVKPIVKQWPVIKYYGFVKNTSTKKKGLCLVRINHNLIKIQKGETHNGISIIAVFKDSIQLSSDQDLKTILKE